MSTTMISCGNAPKDTRSRVIGGLVKDPTLFEQLDKDDHEGTLEDPIPVPESVTTSGFTYIYGKYYSWQDKLYLCKRGGVSKSRKKCMGRR